MQYFPKLDFVMHITETMKLCYITFEVATVLCIYFNLIKHTYMNNIDNVNILRYCLTLTVFTTAGIDNNGYVNSH